MTLAMLRTQRPTPKAQRTRRRILETSLALFRQRGFDETSMRDIAARAGLSPGSTYYHFRSKEELVFAFYVETHEAAVARNRETLQATSSFRERLADAILFKLEQLQEARALVAVLARSALEPSKPLSPFSAQTRDLREGAVQLLREAVEGSDLKVHRRLRPHLPWLLWMLQMGVIFFWIHDASPGQQRTRRVVDACLTLLDAVLPLTASRLPGVGRGVSLVVELFETLDLWDIDAEAGRPT
jgi:AcrR family transcriptional regulator